MAIDPSEIELTAEDRKALAQLANDKGWQLHDLVGTLIALADGSSNVSINALRRAQEEALKKVWDNEEDAVFDDL